MTKLRAVIVILFVSITAYSRAAIVKGSAVDASDTSALVEATVKLLKNDKDSTYVKGTTTRQSGGFTLENVAAGDYLLSLSYVGYDDKIIKVSVRGNVDVGQVKLSANTIMLKDAVVVGVVSPVVVKEDTVEYNAGSYKTQPNAAMEELLKRLPGVEIDDDGKITANGKEIKKIMVDGKEFFSDDPKVASKNIPANMIDKLQVIDQLSDLAQLTGVDDGNDQTVINIVVKKGMKTGWFGNMNAGYGTDNRYAGNVNLNHFVGDDQLTILGGANNTGGGQGLNRASSGGISFNVGKEDTLRVNGSVMYNHSDRNIHMTTDRQYLFPDSTSYYNSASRSYTKNDGINGNFRIKWQIDSFNVIEVRPRIGFSWNSSNSSDTSMTRAGDAQLSPVNNSMNERSGSAHSLSFSNQVVYNHKFQSHRGRSYSVQLTYSHGNSDSDADSYSRNYYYRRTTGNEDIRDQHTDNSQWNNSVNGRVSWTEPLGNIKNVRFIDISYSSSYRSSNSDKMVYDISRDSATHSEVSRVLSESQSNSFRNDFFNQNFNISFRQIRPKYNLNIGLALRSAMSKSKNLINADRNLAARWVWTLTPQVRFRYRFNKTRNLAINYRTNSNQPSISQLQPVVDESNPLRIVVGNPNLKPVFQHRLSVNYNDYNAQSQRSVAFSLGVNYEQNSIISTTDYDSITGGRTTTYRNVNGVWNINTGNVLSLPIGIKQLFFTSHSSLSFSQDKGYNNGLYNRNSAFNVALSPGIAYRNDYFEVELRPRYHYQLTHNTVQTKNNREVNIYGGTLETHYNSPFGLVLGSDLNYRATSGYSSGYNTKQWIWNASVAYQFLKGRAASVSLSCHDILHQLKNVSRGVTASYLQDISYNSLTRYVMLTFSYKFKTFTGHRDPVQSPERHHRYSND
jgi:hypothetical protein